MCATKNMLHAPPSVCYMCHQVYVTCATAGSSLVTLMQGHGLSNLNLSQSSFGGWRRGCFLEFRLCLQHGLSFVSSLQTNYSEELHLKLFKKFPGLSNSLLRNIFRRRMNLVVTLAELSEHSGKEEHILRPKGPDKRRSSQEGKHLVSF